MPRLALSAAIYGLLITTAMATPPFPPQAELSECEAAFVSAFNLAESLESVAAENELIPRLNAAMAPFRDGRCSKPTRMCDVARPYFVGSRSEGSRVRQGPSMSDSSARRLMVSNVVGMCF